MDGRDGCPAGRNCAAHTVPRTFLFKYFCISVFSCWSRVCVCAWWRCLASTCKSQDATAPSKAVTGEWPALTVLWFHPFPECLKAIGLCICFPSFHCCQLSVILTGVTVTVTDTLFSAGCHSLFDHQNTNDTWLFSSRIVICIPKCTM